MNNKEREDWLSKLDSRKVLWERKCVQARNRMKSNLVLGEVDLGIAEAALRRISLKRQQILDKAKAELEGQYPVPIKVVAKKEESEMANAHTHNLSPEEEDNPQFAKVTETVIVKKKKAKKKVHKNPGAMFALAVKEDEK